MHGNLIKRVIDMALLGDTEVFVQLREQYLNAKIVSQTCNSVGFFVNFEVANLQLEQLKYRDNFQINNVHGTVNGIEGAVGFIVFIKNGVIDFLEGYTILDSWPENDDEIELFCTLNKYQK